MRLSRRKHQTILTSLIDSLETRALLAMDFGDAPVPYPVTLAENGARHTVTLGTPRFGNSVDTEADGVHSSMADGDGADENGIEFSLLFADRPASVRINPQNLPGAGGPPGAKVDAWVDFNQDGDWSDSGEQIFDSLTVVNFQDQFLAFNVSEAAVVGYTFARFRISLAGGLDPTGAAPDGEVQDHRVYIGLPAPIITAPAQASYVNVTGTNRVTITWAAVPQAQSYDVWINYGSQAQWHRATVSGTSYTPDQDFGVGEYRLWIRSLGTGNLASAWSPERYFKVTVQTTIVAMEPIQNTSRPTITWNPVNGATYYVWISDLTQGRQVLGANSLTSTSFTPTEDLPLGSYRVWVAVEPTAVWSLPVDFRVATAPVVTGGVNPTFDRTPTFVWNAVTGAATYEFQLRNQNTGVTVINQTGITGTSFTPASSLPDGPYRWWVRAKTSGNFYGLWTAPTDIFIGGRSTVLTPVGSSNQSTPTFTWRPVDGAARYELWVSRVDGPVVINRTDITTTSYIHGSVLADGNYRVWVRAVSATSEFSPWSLQVDFTIVNRIDDAIPNSDPEESQLLASLLASVLLTTEQKTTVPFAEPHEFEDSRSAGDDATAPLNTIEPAHKMAAGLYVTTDYAEVDTTFDRFDEWARRLC